MGQVRDNRLVDNPSIGRDWIAAFDKIAILLRSYLWQVWNPVALPGSRSICPTSRQMNLRVKFASDEYLRICDGGLTGAGSTKEPQLASLVCAFVCVAGSFVVAKLS